MNILYFYTAPYKLILACSKHNIPLLHNSPVFVLSVHLKLIRKKKTLQFLVFSLYLGGKGEENQNEFNIVLTQSKGAPDLRLEGGTNVVRGQKRDQEKVISSQTLVMFT